MSSHFTLAVTSVMQNCKPVGPWRDYKPLHLLFIQAGVRKPLGTEVEGDIFYKNLKAQHPHKKSLFPASG